jgi:hypothetical protein
MCNLKSEYRKNRYIACKQLSGNGINRTPISFLMVDLDLKDFFEDSKKKGNAVLESIKQNLAEDQRI